MLHLSQVSEFHRALGAMSVQHTIEDVRALFDAMGADSNDAGSHITFEDLMRLKGELDDQVRRAL